MMKRIHQAIVIVSVLFIIALGAIATPETAYAQESQRTQPQPTLVTGSTLTKNAIERLQPEKHRVAAPRTNGGNSKIVTTCRGVRSCNDFIALCAASGGDFTPTRYDSIGRPSSGQCRS